MNTTSVEVFPREAGVISDYDFVTIDSAFAYCMIIISIVGIITNLINIRTFIAMGLEDGITVSLLGLALSDFGFTFFGFVLGIANTLSGLEARHGLNTLPIAPRFVFDMFAANLGYMFYQITCMITTFIAVARCMCVAMPFQFKNFFTRTKSTTALVIFCLVAMSSYVPLLSQMGVHRAFDPMVNRTRYVLWLSSQRSEVKNVVSSIHFVVFVFISSVVVVICVVIMAKYLKQSGKFRHSSASGNTGSDGKEKSDYKLAGKELQVVQQVVVICTIYSACLVPTIFFAIYRLIEKDFDVGKRLHNLYFAVSGVQFIVELTNSATTFPVYYVYNSKFRSHFWSKGGNAKISHDN